MLPHSPHIGKIYVWGQFGQNLMFMTLFFISSPSCEMQFFVLTAAMSSCSEQLLIAAVRMKNCICEVGELKVGLFLWLRYLVTP